MPKYKLFAYYPCLSRFHRQMTCTAAAMFGIIGKYQKKRGTDFDMLPYVILAIENESDRDFMARLYTDYRLLMFSSIKKIINDQDVAEDLIQDVLVKLIEKIDLLRDFEHKRLAAYIVTACKNHARNYIRALHSRDIASFDDLPAEPPSETVMEDVVISKMLLEQLLARWGELPENVQELLERKYILFQTDEEIALAMGGKPSSIRMKLTRARKAALAMLECAEPMAK